MKYSKVKAYKYKLEENFVRQTAIVGFNFDTRYYSMLDDGAFLEKRGYCWDGSSVPYKKLLRIASLWIYDPDKYCKEASLTHDGLCQAIREGLLPAICKLEADLLYRKMCIEGRKAKTKKLTAKKLKKIRAWAAKRYWAVREFGEAGIKPEKKPRNKIYDTEKGG